MCVCVFSSFVRFRGGGASFTGPFRNFLELVPPVRELVLAVYEGRYGAAVASLEALQGHFALDLHLKVYSSRSLCTLFLMRWCVCTSRDGIARATKKPQCLVGPTVGWDGKLITAPTARLLVWT